MSTYLSTCSTTLEDAEHINQIALAQSFRLRLPADMIQRCGIH